MSFVPRGIVAVDKQGDRLLFLDPGTLETVAEITAMPPLPHELVLSPDRERAYVPAYGDGVHGDNAHPNHFISVIDLQRRCLERNIDLAPLEAPHTLRFGPEGLLYVACENSGAVAVFDVREGRLLGKIPTGSRNSHRLVILPRSGLICTDNEEDGSMSVLGLGDHSFRGKVALPAALAGIAALPDESMIFCTVATSPQLWSVAMNGMRVGRPIWLSGHTRGAQVVRVSPDGSLLLVIGDHEPVITLLETGSGRQRSVKVGTKPMDGAFHPDGRTFLICNEGEGTLAEIDLLSARVIRTVPAGKGCETLAYF